MNSIDWKRKLTSRKFGAAVAGFVTPLLLSNGATSAQATQVTALIMSGAAIAAVPAVPYRREKKAKINKLHTAEVVRLIK